MNQRWWGYKHISGSFQAKPYWDKRDLDEAYASGFCKFVVEPFYAVDRDSALMHIEGVTNKMEWEQERNGEYPIVETHKVHCRGPGTMTLLQVMGGDGFGELTILDGSDVLFTYQLEPGRISKVIQYNLKFGAELSSRFRGVGTPMYQIHSIPRAQ